VLKRGIDLLWVVLTSMVKQNNEIFKKSKEISKRKIYIFMHVLCSSVDGEKCSVSPTVLSVVFKSLCDQLSVSYPSFCEKICLQKSKWCPKSKAKVSELN
jgi:hypothetical protein